MVDDRERTRRSRSRPRKPSRSKVEESRYQREKSRYESKDTRRDERRRDRDKSMSRSPKKRNNSQNDKRARSRDQTPAPSALNALSIPAKSPHEETALSIRNEDKLARKKKNPEDKKRRKRDKDSSMILAKNSEKTVNDERALEIFQEGSMSLANVEPARFRRECVKQLNNPDYSDMRILVKSVYEMTKRARSGELCVNCYEELADHNTTNMHLCMSCVHINLARCHYCHLEYESTEFLERLKAPGRFPTCLECARNIFSFGQPNFCEFCKRHCAWKSSWGGADSIPSNRFRNFCEMCSTARQKSKVAPKTCFKCNCDCQFPHPHGAKPVCINCDVVKSKGRESIIYFFMDPVVSRQLDRIKRMDTESLRQQVEEKNHDLITVEIRNQKLQLELNSYQLALTSQKSEVELAADTRREKDLQITKDIAELEGKIVSINKDGSGQINATKRKLKDDAALGARTRVRVLKEGEDKRAELQKIRRTIREKEELQDMEENLSQPDMDLGDRKARDEEEADLFGMGPNAVGSPSASGDASPSRVPQTKEEPTVDDLFDGIPDNSGPLAEDSDEDLFTVNR